MTPPNIVGGATQRTLALYAARLGVSVDEIRRHRTR
jgi:hypothetical protein